MYQMFCGRLPFAAEGLGELLLAHMTQPPTPLHELCAGDCRRIAAGRRARDGRRSRRALSEGRRDDGGDRRRIVGPVRMLVGAGRRPEESHAGAAVAEFEPDTVGGNVAVEEALPTSVGRRKRARGGAGDGRRRSSPSARVARAHDGDDGREPPSSSRGDEAGGPLAADDDDDDDDQVPAPAHTDPPEGGAASPAAADVHVEVHAAPANAQLFLDDAPIANPFDGQFGRSGEQHKLEGARRGTDRGAVDMPSTTTAAST